MYSSPIYYMTGEFVSVTLFESYMCILRTVDNKYKPQLFVSAVKR